MLRSVLVGAADAPSWKHHDVAQLLIMLSYITAAGDAHRALSPTVTSVVVGLSYSEDRYRGNWRWLGRGPSDGDVGAPSGTASMLFRIRRRDGRAMAWQAKDHGVGRSYDFVLLLVGPCSVPRKPEL